MGTASAIARVASMPLTRGHPDVHEHDVGGELLGLGDGVLAVLGLADDLDALLGLEHHDQPAAEQGVVVTDQHPDGIAGWLLGQLRCGAVAHVPPSSPATPPD